jgi:mercuric ion binding protein
MHELYTPDLDILYKQQKSNKMKNRILILLIAFQLFNLSYSFGQKAPKFESIDIKTSAQCNTCMNIIYKELAFVKGVKNYELNLESGVLRVKYKPSVVEAKTIKQAISNVGYDADDIPAKKESYDKLPDCCKKGGHR